MSTATLPSGSQLELSTTLTRRSSRSPLLPSVMFRADPLEAEVVRAFFLLYDQCAGRRGREGFLFELLGAEQAQPGQAEACAAEPAQRAATGQPVV
jgi:hypothetical protein